MAFLPTNATSVQAFAGALYGLQVGTATMAQVNNDITSFGGLNNALNAYYGASFGSTATATVAASLVANIGISAANSAAAVSYVTGVLNATTANARGAAVMNILNQLASLTADATFGADATAWNTKVANSVAYTGSTDTAVGTVVNQTFTLTTASDNVAGTSGSDVINGSVSATAADNTLTLTDVINGGAGTDTLNVMASVAAANIAVPSAGIQNVETINIRAIDADGTVGTDAATFASVAGVTAVNADRNSSNVTVTNLATGASVGMIGDGSVANGILKYAYATATADQVINVSGGTSNTGVADITATASAGVTKATINSTGAANKVDTITLDSAAGNTVTSLTVNAATDLTATLTANDFAATAALTVTGAAAKVDLGANFDGKTVDASGLTAGGVTIAVNANTTSFKGGQGNDVVTTAAVTSTTAGIIDAGAGTADVIVVADDAHIDTAAEAALYSNFEVVRNTEAGGIIDVSLLAGITAVQADAAGASSFTKLTAAQAANITVRQNATNLTVALATDTGTSDVVAITFGDAALNPTSDATGTVTVNGFETVNLKAVQGKTASDLDATIAAFAADKATALNLTGTSFDLSNVGGLAKAVTIDGTALTGYLKVAGNLVNGSTVNSGAGKDTMTLGTGFGTYNTGAGDDTINATAAQLNTGASYNVINGGDGTDTLNITGGAALTIVDNNLSKISNVEKIVVATTVDNNQTITTGGWFDGAFKAAGVDLTTTTAKGTVTIDMTSFTGAAKLSVTTVGTGTTEGQINVQTGSGADNVTVSAAAAGGAGTVKTFDGNDKITTASTEAFDLTGGKGNDTLVLGSSGVETINFESTAANNGVDTITGFEFGATKDVLQFKNFVGAAEAETLGGTIAGSVDASAKNVLTLTDIQDLTASNFGGTASATVIKTAASQKLVVIADKAADLDAIQNIYYVTTDASNVATVTLVGTINEGTFHTDNIITA